MKKNVFSEIVHNLPALAGERSIGAYQTYPLRMNSFNNTPTLIQLFSSSRPKTSDAPQ